MARRLNLVQLERIAVESGYPDYRSLLHEKYVIQGTSLAALGKELGITEQRVRKHLRRYGLKVRGRGGPNNKKVVLTEELYKEVIRDGVPTVAKTLGISYARLNELMNRRWKEQQGK